MRKLILVADDETQPRTLLRDLLSSSGYAVVEASNGREALELARRHPVDLVVADLMMPELEGFGLCRALKGDPETARVPVFLISGVHDQRVRLTALDAGANDFITKPFDTAEFLLRVRNAIRDPRVNP